MVHDKKQSKALKNAFNLLYYKMLHLNNKPPSSLNILHITFKKQTNRNFFHENLMHT